MWSLATLSAVVLMQTSSTTAQQSGASSCSICPREVVGNGDTVLPAGTAGVLTADQTCDETEALASDGAYSEANCFLLSASGVGVTCGCIAGAAGATPTDALEPSPSQPPVRVTGAAPAPSAGYDDGLSGGAIFGIVAGGIVGAAAIFGVYFLLALAGHPPEHVSSQDCDATAQSCPLPPTSDRI